MDAAERFKQLRARYEASDEPSQEVVTRIVAGYDPPVIPTPTSPCARPVPEVAKIIEASERDESIADRRERAKMPAVVEEFLAYRLQREIAAKHGLRPGVVSRMIRDNTTEAQKLDVRRWHTARIERDHNKRERERQGKQRAEQGVIPRYKPVVVAGVPYPSISAAARAFGLRPGTAQRRHSDGIPLDAPKRKHQRQREKAMK